MKRQTTSAKNENAERDPVITKDSDNHEQMSQAKNGMMHRVGLFADKHQDTIIMAASVLVFLAILRFGHKNVDHSCREEGRYCG